MVPPSTVLEVDDPRTIMVLMMPYRIIAKGGDLQEDPI